MGGAHREGGGADHQRIRNNSKQQRKKSSIEVFHDISITSIANRGREGEGEGRGDGGFGLTESIKRMTVAWCHQLVRIYEATLLTTSYSSSDNYNRRRYRTFDAFTAASTPERDLPNFTN